MCFAYSIPNYVGRKEGFFFFFFGGGGGVIFNVILQNCSHGFSSLPEQFIIMQKYKIHPKDRERWGVGGGGGGGVHTLHIEG